MRLTVTVILLLIMSGVLIYYHCAKNGQHETQIEQEQTQPSAISPAVHQPQTKDETANP
jgi:hypothetical protein